MSNNSIESIDRQIHALKERRKALVKIQQREKRLALNSQMIELLSIIENNPGIASPASETDISAKDYNNVMTALRRRNLIINKGTRHSPSWYRV